MNTPHQSGFVGSEERLDNGMIVATNLATQRRFEPMLA
jgi:hypothetical protein